MEDAGRPNPAYGVPLPETSRLGTLRPRKATCKKAVSVQSGVKVPVPGRKQPKEPSTRKAKTRSEQARGKKKLSPVSSVSVAQKKTQIITRKYSRRGIRGPASGPAATSETIWRVVTPPPSRTRKVSTETCGSSIECLSIPRKPRIWANSKEELFQVLPEMAKLLNGIVCRSTEPPVLFLEGPAWQHDSWNGRTTIELSIERPDVVYDSSVAADSSMSTGKHLGHSSSSCSSKHQEPPHPAHTNTVSTVPAVSAPASLAVPSNEPDHVSCLPSVPALSGYHDLYTITPFDSPPSALSALNPENVDMDVAAPESPSARFWTRLPQSHYSHTVPSVSWHGLDSHGQSSSLASQDSDESFRGVTPLHPTRFLDHHSYSLSTAPVARNTDSLTLRPTVWAGQQDMQIEELPDLSSHQTLYECYPSALNPPHPAPQFNFFMEMGMVAPIEEAYNFHRPVGQYDDEEMQQDSGYFSETAWQSDPDDWPVHPDDILGLRGDEYFSNSIPGYSSLMPPQVDAVDMQNVLPLTSQTHDFIHVNSCTGSVAGLSEPTVHEDLTAEIHPPKLNNIGDAPPFDQGEPPNDVVESVPPPREIQALLDCHESHLPIGIMLCRDSSLIPFSLPEEYGCMFLGFFHVKHVRLQREDTPSADTNQSSPPSGQTTRMVWRFTFEWTPGGESLEELSMDPPQMTPWWMPPQLTDGNSEGSDVLMVTHPYTFLPLHLLAGYSLSDEELERGVSEVPDSRGWHCAECGRLNVQRNLCRQSCGHCKSGNRMPPVAAGYVRNPYATAPGTMPWDRYTDCVTSSFEEGANGQQTFDYCMGGDAVVKHLYTCNLGKFQHEPDRLFLRFQIDVELVMRGMKTGPVAGPYYTYVAMDGDVQGGISVPWAKVPPCVLQARELMLGRGHTDGRQPTLSIGQLVVLGWIRPGSRKGCIVSAKKSCVMILCLGADVELSIAAKSVRRPPVPPVSSNGPAFEPIEPVNAVPIDDLGDNAGGNELGGSLPNEISTSRPKVGKGKCIKEKMPPESLFVTLVHGDILMFMGGDFEYAMKRTGMSIILIGSS